MLRSFKGSPLRAQRLRFLCVAVKKKSLSKIEKDNGCEFLMFNKALVLLRGKKERKRFVFCFFFLLEKSELCQVH